MFDAILKQVFTLPDYGTMQIDTIDVFILLSLNNYKAIFKFVLWSHKLIKICLKITQMKTSIVSICIML